MDERPRGARRGQLRHRRALYPRCYVGRRGTNDGPGLAGVNGRERGAMDEAEVLERDGRRS